MENLKAYRFIPPMTPLFNGWTIPLNYQLLTFSHYQLTINHNQQETINHKPPTIHRSQVRMVVERETNLGMLSPSWIISSWRICCRFNQMISARSSHLHINRLPSWFRHSCQRYPLISGRSGRKLLRLRIKVWFVYYGIRAHAEKTAFARVSWKSIVILGSTIFKRELKFFFLKSATSHSHKIRASVARSFHH